MVCLRDTMRKFHGIEVSDSQELELMENLHAVMKANETINLTRIVSEESGRVLHLEDSLTGLPYIEKAPQGLYGDLGTGGGFPGIPLCIMTRRSTILIDSVQKKVRVLREIAEELELDDLIEGYAGRIEDLALERKGQFAVLTARALSSLPALMELASPLLMKKGRLICYKAQPSKEEVEQALGIQELVGMNLICDDSFKLSDGSSRRILVFEKVGSPSLKLPRRIGMAQHSPLDKSEFKKR